MASALTLAGCSPFGQSSFIDNLNSIADDILTLPFKDAPVKYGDAQSAETVITNGDYNGVVGYELKATVQEISDSQSTISATSSTPGYTFTEVYFQ